LFQVTPIDYFMRIHFSWWIHWRSVAWQDVRFSYGIRWATFH